jgi:hypothetical protein
MYTHAVFKPVSVCTVNATKNLPWQKPNRLNVVLA